MPTPPLHPRPPRALDFRSILRSAPGVRPLAAWLGFQPPEGLRTSRAPDVPRPDTDAPSAAKARLLANVSHEIRTPIAAIIGFADLILDSGTDPAAQAEAAHTIRRNAQRLLRTLNDILDLSKLEAGKMSLAPADCSPAHIVHDVRTLLALRASSRGLTLDTRTALPIPLRVRSDADRIRQILINLVGNAINFTPPPPAGPGRITITLSHEPATQIAAARVRFDVTDSGPGIDPAALHRLFQPFQQGLAASPSSAPGTGLGLSISRRLAELLGGRLSCTVHGPSRPGCTFSLLVPVGTPADTRSARSEPELAADLPADAAPPVPNTRLRGRILLIEDSPDSQRLISHLLRSAGARVDLADTGPMALHLADGALHARNPYDLVLTDLCLTDASGLDIVADLRARSVSAPILALTAHAMLGDRERCLAAGCDDYLTKPIDRAALISACARWLEESRRRAAA